MTWCGRLLCGPWEAQRQLPGPRSSWCPLRCIVRLASSPALQSFAHFYRPLQTQDFILLFLTKSVTFLDILLSVTTIRIPSRTSFFSGDRPAFGRFHMLTTHLAGGLCAPLPGDIQPLHRFHYDFWPRLVRSLTESACQTRPNTGSVAIFATSAGNLQEPGVESATLCMKIHYLSAISGVLLQVPLSVFTFRQLCYNNISSILLDFKIYLAYAISFLFLFSFHFI